MIPATNHMADLVSPSPDPTADYPPINTDASLTASSFDDNSLTLSPIIHPMAPASS